MRQELAAIHSGQNEIAVEVAVPGGNVRDVKETLNIIEVRRWRGMTAPRPMPNRGPLSCCAACAVRRCGNHVLEKLSLIREACGDIVQAGRGCAIAGVEEQGCHPLHGR